VIGVLGMYEDITEQKIAATALRERNEVFSAIVSRAVESILLVDAETLEFLEFNDAACESLGYTREEFARLTLADVQGVFSPEQIREIVVRAATLPDGIRYENKHRHKDGSLRDRNVSARAVTVRGRDCFAHVWHDITAEKSAARALQESAMFLDQTQRIASVGGWKANPETDMLLWTEEVYRLCEHPLDQPPAGLQDGLLYYAPEYLARIRDLLGRAWTEGTPFTVETEMIARSGRRFWAELRCVGRVNAPDGDFLMGTFQDIGERKEAEQALRASEQRYRSVFNTLGEGIA
jgi:PAS domain S-box-containing protein